MDKVLLLLTVAGLVVGVALVSGTLMNNQRVSTENIEEPTVERTPEDNKIEEEQKLEQTEPDATYRQEERAIVSSDIQSLDFKVDVTTNGESYTSRFRVRQPGDENEDIRIDSTRDDGAKTVIILKGSTDEGWVKDYSSNEWTKFTGFAFTQMWQTRANQYLAYRVNEWKEMEGQEFTVEDEDGTGRVYDIWVNEGIPDSVFSPD